MKSRSELSLRSSVRHPLKKLTLIFAVSDAGVIGKGGGLPWKIPEDMRYFRDSTMGHAVIMGRRTFEEVNKPLKGRRNIVVSRAGKPIDGCEVATSFEAACELAWTTDEEPMVIGGAQIYAEAMPRATKILLTEVHREVDGDTYFQLDRAGWRETERRRGVETSDIEFVTLER